MVRKNFAFALLVVWLTVWITGCVGKGETPLPHTPTPSATTALRSTTPTPYPDASPVSAEGETPIPRNPTPSATTAFQPITPTPHPNASPGPEEGKPTPPGGERPFVLPPAATLPPLNTSWQEYELAEIGLRIRMPAEWEKLNMPGGACIFAAGGEYRVTVSSCCVELPHSLSEFQEALAPYLRGQYEEDFTIVPMTGRQWEGVGAWYKSNPNVCLVVYIPAPEIVRMITFFDPVFCEPDGEHLVPLGEMILDSVEILPPKAQ